jgi:repressor LexA
MLTFISEFLDDQGYPPTVRDIQNGCDVSSTSVVDYNLNILQRAGLIRRAPDVSRGIEVLDGSGRRGNTVQVPLMGFIAAGEPLPIPSSDDWAGSEPMETLDVAKNMLRGEKDVYALRVRGTSMIDAFVDDGDLVFVSRTGDVRDGDMVVAWLTIEKEATLKRLYREGERVRLQPANSQMKPIYVDAEGLEIQGKVVAVQRELP